MTRTVRTTQLRVQNHLFNRFQPLKYVDVCKRYKSLKPPLIKFFFQLKMFRPPDDDTTYVFTTEHKSIKAEMIASDTFKVVCLSRYHLFLAFENGLWMLIDVLNEKIVRKSMIGEKIIDFKVLDESTIVYISDSPLKLEKFNPFTQKSVFSEKISNDLHIPTNTKWETYSYYTDYEIEVLKKSRIIVILYRTTIKERHHRTRTSSEFKILSLSFISEDHREFDQVYHPREMGSLKFRKVNEENLLILYDANVSYMFNHYFLDINQLEMGLQRVEIDLNVSGEIINLFPWSDQTLLLFGNFQKEISHIIYDCKSGDVDTFTANCKFEEVLIADNKKQLVLSKTRSDDSRTTLTLWRSFLDKIEYIQDCKLSDATHFSNFVDESYCIEAQLCSGYEEDSNKKEVIIKKGQKEGICTLKLAITKLVKKRIFVLYLIKNGFVNNKRFFDIHGQVDVVKDLVFFF